LSFSAVRLISIRFFIGLVWLGRYPYIIYAQEDRDMPRIHLYSVQVKGDLGLKTYYVAVEKDGLGGKIQAKEWAENAYKEELDQAKDRLEPMEPREVAVVQNEVSTS